MPAMVMLGEGGEMVVRHVSPRSHLHLPAEPNEHGRLASATVEPLMTIGTAPELDDAASPVEACRRLATRTIFGALRLKSPSSFR